MEIIRRITEFRDKRILLYPFWRRLLTFSMISGFLVFYHHAVANWGFDECPKEDCPFLYIWDNPNEWRYPEKDYMTKQQTMAKEIFLWTWWLLIPDWREAYQTWFSKIRQKFESFSNQGSTREATPTNGSESIEMKELKSISSSLLEKDSYIETSV